MTIDQGKLGELAGTFVADLGATIAAGNVVVGHRLGLYRSLAGAAATADQLAQRTGTDPRYVAEWLRGQAAGGYVSYDPASEQFSLTEEQAYALADPDGPLYLPGAFVLALGALRAESQITDAFRTGAGMGWHEHHEDVFTGCEMFFRPGYLANLTSSWIPALDGVDDKLSAGGRVADVGCGHGASSVLLAQAYPRARVLGSDYHQASIDTARKRAADAGVADRARFEVASAQMFSGTGYDLDRDLRLPARHGRPGRRGPAHPAGARRRRHLADRRAAGRRCARRQSQPGRPRVLLLFHVLVRAERPLPARRVHPRRPGRRDRHPPGGRAGRVHPVPPGRRDTVQRRLPGPALTALTQPAAKPPAAWHHPPAIEPQHGRRQTAMTGIAELHAGALEATGRIVRGVAADRWHASTPCPAGTRAPWSIISSRATCGRLSSPRAARSKARAAGSTVTCSARTRPAAYDASAKAAAEAFRRPGVLDAPCAVSYGPVPGSVYAGHRFFDVFIHGWDLATATGQDATLDAGLMQACRAVIEPQLEAFRGAGALASPLPVPPGAGAQARFLAMLGRAG